MLGPAPPAGYHRPMFRAGGVLVRLRPAVTIVAAGGPSKKINPDIFTAPPAAAGTTGGDAANAPLQGASDER